MIAWRCSSAVELLVEVALVAPHVAEHVLALHDLDVAQRDRGRHGMAAERDAVHPVAAGQERLGHLVGDHHGAERLVGRGQPLRRRDDVGLEVVLDRAEPLAEPAERADHLVGDLQHAVGVADLAHALVVARVRGEGAAGVLHGLGDHHRDGVGPLELDRLGDLVGAAERALGLVRAVLAAVAVRVRDVPRRRGSAARTACGSR